jgi:putative flippase GtrA
MIDIIRRATWLHYLAASALALGVDMGGFLMLLETGVTPAIASGLGYAAGIVAHWWLSSRAVFAGRLAMPGFERQRQQGLFLLSALVGLGITMAIVGLGHLAGLDPRLAKLVAVGVAFQTTYLLRRRIVFA